MKALIKYFIDNSCLFYNFYFIIVVNQLMFLKAFWFCAGVFDQEYLADNKSFKKYSQSREMYATD